MHFRLCSHPLEWPCPLCVEYFLLPTEQVAKQPLTQSHHPHSSFLRGICKLEEGRLPRQCPAFSGVDRVTMTPKSGQVGGTRNWEGLWQLSLPFPLCHLSVRPMLCHWVWLWKASLLHCCQKFHCSFYCLPVWFGKFIFPNIKEQLLAGSHVWCLTSQWGICYFNAHWFLWTFDWSVSPQDWFRTWCHWADRGSSEISEKR